MNNPDFKPSFENYQAEGIAVSAFLDTTGLQNAQIDFEQTRVGTDGSLWEYNNLQFSVTRGIIGEANELLEDVEAGKLEHAKEELADVIIFAMSVANHLGISPDELGRIADEKMQKNLEKYKSEYFIGKSVKEGLKESRDKWHGVIYEANK